jgi:hypothetical protein
MNNKETPVALCSWLSALSAESKKEGWSLRPLRLCGENYIPKGLSPDVTCGKSESASATPLLV